jgi:hypothetical protein
MSWYRTGTVAVTNGSKTVTGVGTLWTTAVNAGDAFALVDANLNPTGAWYEVESVTNNTTLVLKQSYAGSTGSNKQYCVFNLVGNMTTPSFAQRLATFFASFQSLIDKPTTTPTAASIPVADANGKIDSGWIKDASATVKGVVEVGANLSVDNGVISVPEATETVKGVVELATSAEVLAGTDTEKAVTVKDLDYSYATIDSDRIYEGVDLETKFAAEIAGYSDVWAWIKARITAVDYSGLHVGDYVPFSMNGNAIKAQIAGIDTYREYGDVAIGHHIDFISKDCYPVNVLWNTTNVNNGSAANAAPWMVSNIKSVLNTTWYGYLPAALQAQIIEKRLHIETRYTSGSTLTDSTSWAWNDIGKLWVPSEIEVYGSIVWGTKGYSQNGSVQYPIFSGNSEKRVKNQGEGGNRCTWWLLSVYGGNSTHVCAVSTYGTADYYSASHATIYAPVCFRIG